MVIDLKNLKIKFVCSKFKINDIEALFINKFGYENFNEKDFYEDILNGLYGLRFNAIEVSHYINQKLSILPGIPKEESHMVVNAYYEMGEIKISVNDTFLDFELPFFESIEFLDKTFVLN